MTAFAQREHFLERPMFLTAPPVGRFAVQNSQRFHYYGELRVTLGSFNVNGAETGCRRMPACGPAFRVFRALRQCVSGLNLARQVPHVSMLAFVLSDDLFRLTSSAIFSDAWPATH